MNERSQSISASVTCGVTYCNGQCLRHGWLHREGPRIAAFRALTDRFEFGVIHMLVDAAGTVKSQWWVSTGEVIK